MSLQCHRKRRRPERRSEHPDLCCIEACPRQGPGARENRFPCTEAWSTCDDPVTTVPSDWHPLARADDHGLVNAVRLDRTDGFTTVASDRRFLRYERHRADQHERGDDGFTVRGSLVTVTTASINLSGEGFLRDHHHRW